MIKQINPDNSKTIFIDGVYEEDRNAGGIITNTRVYYPAGGAMRVNGVVSYVLRDNLGSADVTTDASGNVTGQERYYPFGTVRLTSGSVNTDRTYTGQRNLSSLGLMDYHARMFDSSLGRYIQPDSIISNRKNPQNFNRYSYVNNNPTIYTDPSGHVIQGRCNYRKNHLCDAPTMPSSGGKGGSSDGNSGDPYCLVNPNDCNGSGNSEGNGSDGSSPGGEGIGTGDNWDSDNGGSDWWVDAGSGFSPTQPDWHNYAVGPDLVCPAALNCTESQMKDYFSRFAYPGQNPSYPVEKGHLYSVTLPFTEIPIGMYGSIKIYVLPNGLTSYNVAQPGHVFYAGVAVRSVFKGVDGGWYVETHSYGNNTQYHSAWINQEGGPVIFGGLDASMQDYILHQHGAWH